MWISKNEIESIKQRLATLEEEIASYYICEECGTLAELNSMKSSVILGPKCRVTHVCKKCNKEESMKDTEIKTHTHGVHVACHGCEDPKCSDCHHVNNHANEKFHCECSECKSRCPKNDFLVWEYGKENPDTEE